MRSIPPKMRQEMSNDPFYERCALLGPECGGRIEWHHCWIYGSGGQINHPWAIVPACHNHHEMVKKDKEIKEAFELISLDRASYEDLLPYPRKDWAQIRQYLMEKLRQKVIHSLN